MTESGEMWVGYNYDFTNFMVRYTDFHLSTDNTNNSIRDFSIYPNPAKSEINIKTNSLEKENRVTIYNMIGKVVFDTRVKESINGYSFDISHLNEGLYIMRIENEKGSSQKKIIKY